MISNLAELGINYNLVSFFVALKAYTTYHQSYPNPFYFNKKALNLELLLLIRYLHPSISYTICKQKISYSSPMIFTKASWIWPFKTMAAGWILWLFRNSSGTEISTDFSWILLYFSKLLYTLFLEQLPPLHLRQTVCAFCQKLSVYKQSVECFLSLERTGIASNQSLKTSIAGYGCRFVGWWCF